VAGLSSSSKPFSLGDAIAAASALLLFIFLFLPWFGGAGQSINAWETFSVVDLVLAAIAIAIVVLAVLSFTGSVPNMPFERLRLMRALGIVALFLVVSFSIELSSGFVGGTGASLKIGAILGILASLGIVAGVYLAEHPSLIAGLGSGSSGPGGGGPGIGEGGYGQQQGYGQQPGGYQQPPAVGAPQGQPPTQQQPPAQAAAQSAAAPDRPGQPADWYPDPTGQKRLRYWDGSTWTDHVAD
jgi:hypothetical protein